MKKREKTNPFILASIALLLSLIVFSSLALAASNADTLAFQGNFKEAIKAYDKAIENNSQDSELWYKKGTCLAELGNYTEAIKAFDNATDINPHLLNAWINKGFCLAELGNYTEAIKAYDNATDINPQSPEAWYNKGLSLKKLDNYEEAVKAFDMAIDINSTDSDSWYNKGYSLECLGNYEEAVKAFDMATDIDFKDSEAWYNKGTCLAHLGKYTEAIEALDKAIEIDPQNIEALTLKESILTNSNGLINSLKSLFSNYSIFVEEDDLLEYSQTYLKTYKDIIDKSNLTHDDIKKFYFYQAYPYTVNATISNIHGASVEFIPNSSHENKIIRTSHPIEQLIPKVTQAEKNELKLRLITSPDYGNIKIHDLKTSKGVYIYLNRTTNCNLAQLNCPIILGDKTYINGITYIDSSEIYREGYITINGTLILNNSKVILKSNLKKDWTKEKAEKDAIDLIYKEQIFEIFDYSKLTGIGFREIETLVNNYEIKRNSGYYQTYRTDQMTDLNLIYKKADQYKIHYNVIETTMSDIEKKESSSDEALNLIGNFNTVFDFIGIIAVFFGWFKRREIVQELKNICRYLNNTFRRF